MWMLKLTRSASSFNNLSSVENQVGKKTWLNLVKTTAAVAVLSRDPKLLVPVRLLISPSTIAG